MLCRGGVEDTRLEAKAKDTKKIRGQGPRTAFPRTDTLEAKAKDFKICPRGQGRPRGLHLWCFACALIVILNFAVFEINYYYYKPNLNLDSSSYPLNIFST